MSPSETVASPRLAGVVDHQQFTRQLPADRKWALGLQVGRLLKNNSEGILVFLFKILLIEVFLKREMLDLIFGSYSEPVTYILILF